MFYFNLFIVFLLLGSCTKYSPIEFKGEMVIISPENMKVDKIHEEKWKVGSLGKQVISKGVRIEILLPMLKKDLIKSILAKHNMDSWIIKVKQHSMYRNQTIGHIYFPVFSPGMSKGSDLRVKQMKKGVFGIHYAASAVSTRLSKLSCPAFDHNYRVDEILVDSSYSSRQEKIYISGASSRRVKAKVELFENRIILNGGTHLRGEYYFEIAAYNSHNKKRLSHWVEISGRAKVGVDQKVKIEGCAGVKVPAFKQSSERKSFKFGK